MEVHLENGIASHELDELVNRLKSEKFAEGCFISRIEQIGAGAERHYYLRLPTARHGVLVSASGLTPAAIAWAIDALCASVGTSIGLSS